MEDTKICPGNAYFFHKIHGGIIGPDIMGKEKAARIQTGPYRSEFPHHVSIRVQAVMNKAIYLPDCIQ